jgi:DNA-binding transcriptional ArsR family regulator
LEDQIYSYHADMCQVFSHPKRLEIINTLRNGEMTVTELSQSLGMTVANMSQHLSLMRDRHILLSRKEGNMVFYRIANPKLLNCFDIMREMLFEQIRQDAALVTR